MKELLISAIICFCFFSANCQETSLEFDSLSIIAPNYKISMENDASEMFSNFCINAFSSVTNLKELYRFREELKGYSETINARLDRMQKVNLSHFTIVESGYFKKWARVYQTHLYFVGQIEKRIDYLVAHGAAIDSIKIR